MSLTVQNPIKKSKQNNYEVNQVKCGQPESEKADKSKQMGKKADPSELEQEEVELNKKKLNKKKVLSIKITEKQYFSNNKKNIYKMLTQLMLKSYGIYGNTWTWIRHTHILKQEEKAKLEKSEKAEPKVKEKTEPKKA